jgi:hypothetical protein
VSYCRSTGCANRLTRLHNVKSAARASAPKLFDDFRLGVRSRHYCPGDWLSTCSLRSQGASFCKLGLRSLTKARRGGANRDRTDDLKLAKLALSQLSYGPVAGAFGQGHSGTALMAFSPSIGPPDRSIAASRANGFEVVGLGRLELPTSRLSSARSNQLSYKPDEASSLRHRVARMAARR